MDEKEKELHAKEIKGYEGSIYPLLKIPFKRAVEINSLVYKAFYKISLGETKDRSVVEVYKIMNKDLKTNYEIAAACMMIGRAIESAQVAAAFINEGKKLSKLN